MAGRALAYEFGFDKLSDEIAGSSSSVVPLHDDRDEPMPLLDDTTCKHGSDGGDGLRTYLLREFKCGRLSSEAVCSLAWHASRAGAANVADLGLDPKSRKQAEHLRKAMH